MALEPEKLQKLKMRRPVGMTIRGELGLTEGTCWYINKRQMAFVSSEPFRPGAIVRVRCDFGRELIDLELRIVRQLDKQWAPRPHRGVPHVARYRLVNQGDKRDLRDGIRRVNPELFPDEAHSTSSARSSGSASRAPSSVPESAVSSFAFRDREDIFKERDKDPDTPLEAPTWAMASHAPSVPPAKRPTRRDEMRTAIRKAAGARTSNPTPSARGTAAPPTKGSMAAKVEARRRKRAARLREAAQQAAPQPAHDELPDLYSTTASVSRAGGPPTVFVAFEDLKLARRSLKASGSAIFCAVGDDGSLAVGDEVLLVLQLPNHVYLQVQAKVSARDGGSTTLVAAKVPADAQLLAAILS